MIFYGTTGALEIYTRDAAAVCVEHSEEAELDLPGMAFISEQMVPKNKSRFAIEC